MSELTGLEAASALATPIGSLGGRWLLAPEVLGPSKEDGYPNGFVYYFRGRGGVLGDVDAGVVNAAFGFFKPDLVRLMWEMGDGVETPRDAARRYGLACAEYGRSHYAGFGGAARFVELAERLVDGAGLVGLALFAGWRAEPRPEDALGRTSVLLHVLREWRGSVHVVAAAASGLTPLESILTGEGSERAKLFGWGDPFDDVSHLMPVRAEVEQCTDRICAVALDALLTGAERAELVELTLAIEAAAT